MTTWERFVAGNDEIIPIRPIDFNADLITAYLTPGVSSLEDSARKRDNMTTPQKGTGNGCKAPT
jgi:hypothetical protein|nr:MAG TPA: hypothetical protein [Caudoviricetes sp.]